MASLNNYLSMAGNSVRVSSLNPHSTYSKMDGLHHSRVTLHWTPASISLDTDCGKNISVKQKAFV